MKKTAVDTPVKVTGIVVTYRPDGWSLLKALEIVRPQVDELIIINNGTVAELPTFPAELDLIVCSLGTNLGLARAQNQGIDRAISGGATYVLLLDQDSVPAANMVAVLLEIAQELTSQGVALAAVGPCYVDDRQGETSPFIYRAGCILKTRTPNEGDLVEVEFLIASGSLIPIPVIHAVGMMEEKLFIDYVDIEWGIRAKCKGFTSFGSYRALMQHSLGDDWIKVKHRKIPVHSSLRHYYQFRNAIWLSRRPWLPSPWGKLFVSRLFKQFVIWCLFLPNRPKRVGLITMGVWHGIIGRMGKL